MNIDMSRHALRATAVRLLAPFRELDTDDLRLAATISVWGRWFIWTASLIYLSYRPEFGPGASLDNVLLNVVVIISNGSLHVRLLSNRPVTWQWLLGLAVMDVAMTTSATVIAGGFDSHSYLIYYPALTFFAVIFVSPTLSFIWVTMVAAIYSVVSVTIGPGFETAEGDEKALFARIVTMYALVASVNLATKFERERRRQAVDRERELLQERVALSQTIHDTVAQSAYVVGLGIESARDVANPSDQELISRLDATHALSKSTMWELRHPIDAGLIFEGVDLTQTLNSHIAAFSSITEIRAELIQTGPEPSLSTQAKGLFFALAHNAMTNVLRHSEASEMTVRFDSGADWTRLSISDNGIGLPDDYETRGHGFRNMADHAAKLGGRLQVARNSPGPGTVVSCTMGRAPDSIGG